MTMHARQSLALINDLESRFPVDRWSIDGIPVWPLIRTDLYFSLRNRALAQDAPVPRRSPLLREMQGAASLIVDLGTYLWASYADRQHSARIGPANVVFLGDQYSRVLIDGFWQDRLCGPVIDHLRSRGITHLHLERYHEYRIPRNAPSLFIQPALDWALVQSRVQGRLAPAVAPLLEGYTDCRRSVREATDGVTLLDLHELAMRTDYLRRAAEYFRRLFRTIKPRIAFIVEYYSPAGMACVLACRELGILPVDLPHGNHGEIHVAYSKWSRLPDGGNPLMPSVFLCWSEDEAATINEWAGRTGGRHRAVAAGNPWMSIWRLSTNPMVLAYDRRIQKLKRPGHSLHILINYEHRVADMVGLIRRAPSDWFWWVRVHPTRLCDRDVIRHLLQDAGIQNADVDAATDLPLYALLRNIDVHVTECSSVVIEAEAFGIPTVITRHYGTEAFPRQIASGWASPAYGTDAIIEAVRQTRAQGTMHRQAAVQEVHPWADVIDSLVEEALHARSSKGAS